MSVLRLTSGDRTQLIALADQILQCWRGYSDAGVEILAETEGEPHNTITPIARRRKGDYEFDLVLRNNRTTAEHPLGLFHPHGEKRYAEAELCKLLPGYKKSHYNVSSIIVNLERALKNEKAFCETIEELVCNVGSNVGLLIQEMRLIGYKK